MASVSYLIDSIYTKDYTVPHGTIAVFQRFDSNNAFRPMYELDMSDKLYCFPITFPYAKKIIRLRINEILISMKLPHLNKIVFEGYEDEGVLLIGKGVIFAKNGEPIIELGNINGSKCVFVNSKLSLSNKFYKYFHKTFVNTFLKYGYQVYIGNIRDTITWAIDRDVAFYNC